VAKKALASNNKTFRAMHDRSLSILT